MEKTDGILIAFLLMIFASGQGLALPLLCLFLLGVFFLFPYFKGWKLALALLGVLLFAFFFSQFREVHIEEEDFPGERQRAQILWKRQEKALGKTMGVFEVRRGPFRGKEFLVSDGSGPDPGTLEEAEVLFMAFDRPPFPGFYNEEGVREAQGLSGGAQVFVSKEVRGPSFFQKIRNLLRERTEDRFSLIPGPEGSFLQRVLLGFSQEKTQVQGRMETLGLAHLLAASGLHVSILFSFSMNLFSRLFKRRKSLDFFLFPCLFAYAGLLNFPPSICRAGLFLFFRELALLFRKKTSFWRNFELSLALFLLLRPYQAKSYGLLLSYGACLGIHFGRLAERAHPLSSGLLKKLRISLWISLFNLPVLSMISGEANPLVLLANTLAIPFFSFLLPLGTLAYVLGSFPLLGGLLIKIYSLSFRVFESLLEGLFLFSPPSVSLAFLRKSLVLYLFFLGLLVFFRSGAYEKVKGSFSLLSPLIQYKVQEGFSFFIFSILTFSLVFLGLSSLPLEGPLFYGLDVGQGDSLLFRYQGENYLFDTGGAYDFRTQKSRYGDAFVDLLKDLGVQVLDGVFISHMDFDHIGNLRELTEQIPVKKIYLSPDQKGKVDPKIFRFLTEDPEKRGQIPLRMVREGEVFQLGTRGTFFGPPAKLRVLQAGTFDAEDRNNHSMVLLLDYGPRILLTGDQEEDGKYEKNWPEEISLLKLAHHGSAKGTSWNFLRKTQPKKALISSGRNNSYGHPSPELLERLRQAKVPYDRTSSLGTVVYRKGRKGLFSERKGTYETKKILQTLLFAGAFFYWVFRLPKGSPG